MNRKKFRNLLLILMMLLPSLTFGQSKNQERDKKIFLKQSDACLEAMASAAGEMSLKGACVMAYIPGVVADTWVSKMRVVGALQNGSANFLAIAYTKASEMADTFKESGSGVREPVHGEFGYQGGVITKIDSGYILAVFSGGSGEQDVEIARKGLDLLSSYY